MAKKNAVIEAGFSGLLNTPGAAAPQEQAKTPPATAPEREKYKTVCYSIPPDLIEKIKNIAYWDRRKINAVVTEALRTYCDQWTPNTADPTGF